ncbi:MAG: HEPN domain-containing protein [Bacteroidota bacterium]
MKRTKEDLIKYRTQRAYESLEEAKILAQTNHWNTVVNRLYYAAFYIVNALFSKHDILTATHSGVKTEFHRSFIKTKKFNKSVGKLYSELFDKRQEGDYQDFYLFEKEEIEPLIELTDNLVETIEKYINNYLSPT